MSSSDRKYINLITWSLILLCFIGSCVGYAQYYQSIGEDVAWLTIVYQSVKLFVFEDFFGTDEIPWELNICRFLAPALLAGVIISYLFSNLRRSFNLWVIRLFYRDHVIFCGMGFKSWLLIRDYIREGRQVVIIEQDSDNYYLQKIYGKRIRIISGNAEDKGTLLKAGVFRASCLFAFTGSDKTNINISHLVVDLYKEAGCQQSLKIILHLAEHSNLRTFKDYQERHIQNIDFHAFNLHQKVAMRLVDRYSPDQFEDFCDTDSPAAHIVVHGLNPAGEFIITEAAQMYHFAHLKKPVITIVDSDIAVKSAGFRLKYPHLDLAAEIHMVDSVEIFGRQHAAPLKGCSVCFISPEADSEGIRTARRYRQLFLSESYKEHHHASDPSVQVSLQPKIVVVLPREPDILNLFSNARQEAEFLNIDLFEMYGNVCNKQIIADDQEFMDTVAMQIHNIYLSLDSAELTLRWQELTDEQKDFNRYPARHLAIKLRYLGAEMASRDDGRADFDTASVSPEQKQVMAKMEHNRWLAEKVVGGFTEGRMLDDQDLQKALKAKLKWHRAMVPWEQLSDSDRIKDTVLFDDLKAVIDKLNKTLKQNEAPRGKQWGLV